MSEQRGQASAPEQGSGEQPESPAQKLRGEPLTEAHTPGAQKPESEVRGEFNPNTE